MFSILSFHLYQARRTFFGQYLLRIAHQVCNLEEHWKSLPKLDFIEDCGCSSRWLLSVLRICFSRNYANQSSIKSSFGRDFQCSSRLQTWWAILKRYCPKNVLRAWYRWKLRIENILHLKTQLTHIDYLWGSIKWASKAIPSSDRPVWKQWHWYNFHFLLQYFEA
jgi:hypothetical protein